MATSLLLLPVRAERILKPETQTDRSDYVRTFSLLSQEAANGQDSTFHQQINLNCKDSVRTAQ
jgi:hypothetical protein